MGFLVLLCAKHHILNENKNKSKTTKVKSVVYDDSDEYIYKNTGADYRPVDSLTLRQQKIANTTFDATIFEKKKILDLLEDTTVPPAFKLEIIHKYKSIIFPYNHFLCNYNPSSSTSRSHVSRLFTKEEEEEWPFIF
jgi:hypothetical protein